MYVTRLLFTGLLRPCAAFLGGSSKCDEYEYTTNCVTSHVHTVIQTSVIYYEIYITLLLAVTQVPPGVHVLLSALDLRLSVIQNELVVSMLKIFRRLTAEKATN